MTENHKILGLLFPASVLDLFTGWAQLTFTAPPLLLPLACWVHWFAQTCCCCWVDARVSLGVDAVPGLLMPRPMLGGETGPDDPDLVMTPGFSRSFLLFLQVTNSPGWASCCPWSRVLPLALFPNLDSFMGKWDRVLGSSLGVTVPRHDCLGDGLMSRSTSFISLCFLPCEAAAVDLRALEVEVDAAVGPEKDIAFLISWKSTSGKDNFSMSKNRSCTFLASHLTCTKRSVLDQ